MFNKSKKYEQLSKCKMYKLFRKFYNSQQYYFIRNSKLNIKTHIKDLSKTL